MSARVYAQAAAYGKGFCAEAFDSDEFVAMCRKLRVLNAVRAPGTDGGGDAPVGPGLPLTAQQYERLTADALVDRLVTRHHHLLALKARAPARRAGRVVSVRVSLIVPRFRGDRCVNCYRCDQSACSSTGPVPSCGRRRSMPSPTRCEHASGERHTEGLPDAARARCFAFAWQALRDLLHEKLKPCGRGAVPFTDIAAAAERAGRRRLATMLLDYEPRAADQVKLLLSMGEDELALQKAVNSSDSDLIYLAVLHLQEARKGGEHFFRLVQLYPDASALLSVYYRSMVHSRDRSALHNFCVCRGDFFGAGALAARQAYLQPRLDERLELLREAETLFAQSRELGFYKSECEEQINLLKIQRELEQKLSAPNRFIDLSVVQTIGLLVELGAERPADKSVLTSEVARLQKAFKVPDRTFWHVKVSALADSGQWDALRHFSKDRKSPIGYRPFALVCMKHKRSPEETREYIEKISELEQRFGLLLDIALWKDAAEVAFKLKDARRLQEVKYKCSSSNAPNVDEIVALVDDRLGKLR